MHQLITPLATLATLAQNNPGVDIGNRLTDLFGGLVGIMGGAMLTAGLGFMYYRLLQSMLKDPSWGKAITCVGGTLVAIFMAGASPDLVNLAWSTGQSFLDGTPGSDLGTLDANNNLDPLITPTTVVDVGGVTAEATG